MQSYRLIPVGDKIVLIVESGQPLSADAVAGNGQMLDDDAGCYDFVSEGAAANERPRKVRQASGGSSHE